MDVVDAIMVRRSTRRGFMEMPVPDDAIQRIIACGLHAPSSKDAQPWRLHVVTNRETAIVIADLMVTSPGRATYVPTDPATGLPRSNYDSSVEASAQAVRDAPLTVVIENVGSFSGGRRNLISNRSTIRESLVGYTFEVIGLGAAIQNMWLAATGLGLRAVFIGDALIAEEAIKQLLKFDGDLIGILAVGYSSDTASPSKHLMLDRVEYHP
jgi:nitroreductase